MGKYVFLKNGPCGVEGEDKASEYARYPPCKTGRLIYCVPGLVLANFEWAEVVLDFHSECASGAGAAVTLCMT